MYDLHSKFDLDLHNKTYFNYTEVVIYPNGTIEYAVPSHCEKLIQIGIDKGLWKSRDDCNRKIPKEYWFDTIGWLLMQTDCVCVWYDSFRYPENHSITRMQKFSLKRLIDSKAVKFKFVGV